MPSSNKPDIDDTQYTYGSKSNNYVETNSDKSLDSKTTGFASCVSSVKSSSLKTKDQLASASSSVDLKTLHKTDDQGPCNVTQSPSFSFKENVKTPRNLCNRNGSNNISLCKNKSFGGLRPTTSFWEDKWHDSFVLKDLFPRLYVLETNKKMSVGEKLKATSLDSTFRRKPRAGIEQSQYEELVYMVSSTTLIPKNDRYVWSLDNSGSFSVASLREAIDAKRYVGGKSSTRWVKYVPIKVNVMA
ncbi:hypothetical protein Tco_1384056 [Tanacetum coccineum]